MNRRRLVRRLRSQSLMCIRGEFDIPDTRFPYPTHREENRTIVAIVAVQHSAYKIVEHRG